MPIATVSYIACISATTGTDSRDPLKTNVMITLTAMSWIVLTAMYAMGASALPASATQWNAPQDGAQEERRRERADPVLELGERIPPPSDLLAEIGEQEDREERERLDVEGEGGPTRRRDGETRKVGRRQDEQRDGVPLPSDAHARDARTPPPSLLRGAGDMQHEPGHDGRNEADGDRDQRQEDRVRGQRGCSDGQQPAEAERCHEKRRQRVTFDLRARGAHRWLPSYSSGTATEPCAVITHPRSVRCVAGARDRVRPQPMAGSARISVTTRRSWSCHRGAPRDREGPGRSN